MAVKENKLESSMVLKKVVDTVDGKDKFRSQKFSKIKSEADSKDIYDIAMLMSSLIMYPVKEILREDQSLVVNE
ncbi:DUF1659 domain-containing protein [Haloimpatiens sp. FM7315]|uniref:DUF1659 domain-containing protein n=1 Tax=Haloimpatiens sp. FM7315 TaxID=3298609 RepID=UPI0035A3A44E